MAKNKQKEYADAQDRFRQIVNKRQKTLIKYVRLINNMLPQSSYDVTPEDAEKLHAAILHEVSPLLDNLDKLANGQSIKSSSAEIEDIF